MEIYHQNRDLHYKIKVGELLYSNMQLKSHYLQVCIKGKIRNADDQKHIPQMFGIDVYVLVNYLKLKLDN